MTTPTHDLTYQAGAGLAVRFRLLLDDAPYDASAWDWACEVRSGRSGTLLFEAHVDATDAATGELVLRLTRGQVGAVGQVQGKVEYSIRGAQAGVPWQVVAGQLRHLQFATRSELDQDPVPEQLVELALQVVGGTNQVVSIMPLGVPGLTPELGVATVEVGGESVDAAVWRYEGEEAWRFFFDLRQLIGPRGYAATHIAIVEDGRLSVLYEDGTLLQTEPLLIAQELLDAASAAASSANAAAQSEANASGFAQAAGIDADTVATLRGQVEADKVIVAGHRLAVETLVTGFADQVQQASDDLDQQVSAASLALTQQEASALNDILDAGNAQVGAVNAVGTAQVDLVTAAGDGRLLPADAPEGSFAQKVGNIWVAVPKPEGAIYAPHGLGRLITWDDFGLYENGVTPTETKTGIPYDLMQGVVQNGVLFFDTAYRGFNFDAGVTHVKFIVEATCGHNAFIRVAIDEASNSYVQVSVGDGNKANQMIDGVSQSIAGAQSTMLSSAFSRRGIALFSSHVEHFDRADRRMISLSTPQPETGTKVWFRTGTGINYVSAFAVYHSDRLLLQ